MKYLLDESSPEEREQVKNWLALELSNQQYYEHFKLIWEQSRQYRPLYTTDEDAAWKKFQRRIHNTSSTAGTSKAVVRNFGWMGKAAVVLLVVAAAWLTLLFINDRTIHTIVAKTGKSSLVDTLPDGSVITLNKNSLVKYPERFTGGTRKISLEGEAFFNISPDKAKPFIIQVNDVSVRVVGTSFNIKSINGNTEVIVETGVVQVIKNRHSIRLTPKEKTTIHRTDTILAKQAVTDNLYNFYRTKKFYCENTPLWKLVLALNEEYKVNIVIARKDLRTIPLTTVFYDEPLDNILVIIGETLNLSVTHSGDQIVLQ